MLLRRAFSIYRADARTDTIEIIFDIHGRGTAWLADALGLSRSEARLAAQLGDGLRLKEAATQLGWTEETVRSCSKTIYAKMGVQGQAGLLRQLHGAGLWPGDAGDIAPPQTSA